MQYNRGEMKREVKAIMRQSRPSPLLFTALFLIIVWAGSFVIQKVCGLISGGGISDLMAQMAQISMRGGDIEDLMEELMYSAGRDLMGFIMGMMVASLLSGILSYLWTSMMSVGYEGYSLSLQRMENPGVERLFCGFQQFGGVLVTKILVGIFTFLWSLLFIVGAGVLMGVLAAVLRDAIGLLMLLMFLVYIALIVGLVWVMLRYAFADYALLDYKLGGLDAIRRSKEMTKGNKGKIFVLNLSFFGWGLLESLIMLVGVIISVFTLGTQIESLVYILDRDPSAFMASPLSFVLGHIGFTPLIGIALAAIGCFVLELWLTPYRAASMARLYDKIRAAGNYGDVAAAPVAAAPVGPVGPIGPGGPGATVYPPASGPSAYPSNPSGYGAPSQPGYGMPPQSGFGATPPAYGAGGQPYGMNQGVTPPAGPAAPATPAAPPAGQGAYPYSPPTMPLTPSSAASFSTEAPTIVLAPKEKTPAAPAAPAVPVVHEVPQAPAAPVVREVPVAPAAPVVREVPQAPAAPAAPEAPQVPAAPAMPEAPQVPAAPAVPDAPQVPAAPVVPEAPQVPAAPAEPPIPPAAWSANPNDRT